MVDYGLEEPLFIILIVFLVLGWISCLLRAWVKLFVIKKVTADDYLMLCGILFYTAYSASGLYGVTHGVGSAGRDAKLEQASIGLRAWWLCEMLYAPVTLCVRTSVALFLLQIAVQRAHRCIIIMTIAAFWIVTIPLFFIVIFQCNPVDYFWMQPFPSVPRGTCMDGHVVFVVSVIHSAITASCDWVLGILPIFMLWKVRLNKRTKFTLTMLLSMGIFAGIALIVRIAYVRPFDVDVNFLYHTLNVANWSILEPSVCIIAGCLATLRPLFNCFGWSSVSRSSRRTPFRYRQTHSTSKSRTVKSIRGVGFIFNPAYLNPNKKEYAKKDYAVTSRRGNGFMESTMAAGETAACNNYELMVNIEKGTSLFDDCTFARSPASPQDSRAPATCKRTSGHSTTSLVSTKNEEPDDGQQNNQLQPPQKALQRHSIPSSNSLASNHSSRHSNVSSAAAAAQSQQTAQSAQSAPGTPVLTPCHILVKKSMVVEYKTTPQVAAPNSSLPSTPMQTGSLPLATNAALSSETANLPHGNTVNSIRSTTLGAAEGTVFCSHHSVHITGPEPGRN